jgi:CBS domain-containing protein
LMVSMEKEFPSVSTLLEFDSAKENFFAAARHGLKAQFTWFKNRNIPATDLILQELLPLAHLGLQQAELNREDIARYLGIFEERVRSGQTGAAWIVKSYSELPAQGPEYRARTITQSIVEKQASGEPVHCWTSPSASFQDLLQNYSTVERFMSTDLFTVRPHDVVDLAASIMDWERIRHVPVEDDHGNLAGIVSHRDLLHLLATGALTNNVRVPVHAVMKQNPITVTPETSTLEAIDLMRKNGVGCLPVVRNNRLVGIITVYDLLALSSTLLEKALREINH